MEQDENPQEAPPRVYLGDVAAQVRIWHFAAFAVAEILTAYVPMAVDRLPVVRFGFVVGLAIAIALALDLQFAATGAKKGSSVARTAKYWLTLGGISAPVALAAALLFPNFWITDELLSESSGQSWFAEVLQEKAFQKSLYVFGMPAPVVIVLLIVAFGKSRDGRWMLGFAALALCPAILIIGSLLVLAGSKAVALAEALTPHDAIVIAGAVAGCAVLLGLGVKLSRDRGRRS